MSEPQDRQSDGNRVPDEVAEEPGLADRMRSHAASATAKAKDAGERHVSIAIPFRAFERNRSVAASVLAGGIAYRLFLWLLPFCLIVAGLLGLGNADDIENSVSTGGLPEAMVNAIAQAASAADSNSWWLLITGVPLLLWEGYAGAKGLQLIHGLVWNETPKHTKPLKSSLYFSAGICVFIAAISITWWFRDSTTLGRLLVLAVMVLPLAGLWVWVSLWLPHGTASWKALLPGAFLVSVGFLVTHGLVVYFLGPKLEKSMSLYGALGVMATILFFMWVVGRIVVTAPVLNFALHNELRRAKPDEAGDTTAGSPTAPTR